MALSPDGTLFASAGSTGTVKFYKADTGEFLRELVVFARNTQIRDLAFSPDGQRIVLFACHLNQTAEVHVWGVESGKQLLRVVVPLDLQGSARFSLDGTKVICGGRAAKARGRYYVWNAETGREEVNLAKLGSPLQYVTFSPDGRLILCVAEINQKTATQTITLRDTVTAKKLKAHEYDPLTTGSVSGGLFSPDGKRIALCFNMNRTHVLDVASWLETASFDGNPVGFIPDSKHLVCLRNREGSTQLPGALKYGVLDAETGAEVAELADAWPDESWPGRGATISADGSRVLGTSRAQSQELFDLKTGGKICEVKPLRPGVQRVNFSPDGTRIVAGGVSGTIEVFDARSFQFVRCMRDSDDRVSSISFSPDGKKILSTYFRGKASIWDAATGDRLAAIEVSERATYDGAFSPDGRQILTGSGDLLITFWEAETGKKIHAVLGAESGTRAVSYRPDGKRFLCLGRGVEPWDASTKELLLEIHAKMPRHVFRSVRYNSDGSQIFGIPELDGPAGLWSAETGAVIRTFETEGVRPFAGTASPDGTRVVLGYLDGTIRIWGVDGRASLPVINGHRSAVQTLAFSPDGSRFVSGDSEGGYGDLKVWDAATGQQLAVL